MTVKISIEFENAEAAIVALGKLTGIATAAPKAERKGRSDKGQARGPRGGAEPKAEGGAAGAPAGNPTGSAPVAPPAAAPSEASRQSTAPQGDPKVETQPQAVAPAAPGGAPSAPAASVPSEQDAQAALEKLFNAAPPIGGIESARDVMARFGVKRLRDLPANQRGEFIALAEKVLAGGKP